MQEIEAILAKHDIAGVISLHTPGYCEFSIHISPSYSCAKHRGNDIVFDLNPFNFKNQSKFIESAKSTCNMMHMLATGTGSQAMYLIEASEFLDKKLGAEHEKGTFIDKRTLEN